MHSFRLVLLIAVSVAQFGSPFSPHLGSSKHQHGCIIDPITRLTAAAAATVPDGNKDAEAEAPSAQYPLEFVLTPGGTSPHNFGAASPLDEVLHTAERPGNPPEKDGIVAKEQVQAWIDYVKNVQGVTNVIALLEEDELAIYEDAGGLQTLMEENGMTFQRCSMKGTDAPERILGLIKEAEEKGEKILTHCTGGIGRCGRVCAAWLVHRYELSPEVSFYGIF